MKKLMTGSGRVAGKMVRALGLPERTEWFELKVAGGKIVSLRAGTTILDQQGEALVKVVQKYGLIAHKRGAAKRKAKA